MPSLPSMWRRELLHPVVVHFPIALLIVGTAGFGLALALRRRAGADWLLPASRTLLILGVLGAWVAIYTGTLADRIVGRDLCDPLVLAAHEDYAYVAVVLFKAGILLDLVGRRLVPSERWKAWLGRAALAVFIAGAVAIGQVGHLGGKLVYQQAAGVHRPSEDCAEFVE